MTPAEKKNATKNAIAMQRAQKAIRKNEDPNKGNFTFKEYQEMKRKGTFKGSDNYISKKNPE